MRATGQYLSVATLFFAVAVLFSFMDEAFLEVEAMVIMIWFLFQAGRAVRETEGRK